MQPKPKVFLTARWENLIMLNYEVQPEIILPYLPFATEPDLYQGKMLVSLVGFLFRQTRVFGLKWPMHTNFEEVNLRFYVKHFDGVAWKRGVVFISEIVPRPVISFLAGALYHEPYSAMKMRHNIAVQDDLFSASYSWRYKGKWNHIKVLAEASLNDIEAGSEEEFIFEHYWGYNKYNDQTTVEYGVEHDVWQVHKVKAWEMECDVEGLYGKKFAEVFSKKPSSVLLAKGSAVLIRKPLFISRPA